MTQSNVDRRRFLKDAGKSATLAATAQLAVSNAKCRAAGANERVRVGVIGCGGQGKGADVGGLSSIDFAEIVYVCDPDQKRRNEASAAAGDAQPVDDLRRILDDPSIDAVTIATPDHWHTPAAILAMDAGKHVYVEKPCSHNFAKDDCWRQLQRGPEELCNTERNHGAIVDSSRRCKCSATASSATC